MKMIKSNQSSTLCWDCEKNGGGCSWSHDLTPVKGWKAETDYTLFHGKRDNSYTVLECPEFERRHSKTKVEDINDDAMISMMQAVVKIAQHDYIQSYIADFYGISDDVEKLKNRKVGTERLGKIENEIRTGLIGEMFGISRTEALIEKFQKDAKEIINIMALWLDGTSVREISNLTGKTEEEIEILIKVYKKTRNYKVIKTKFEKKERV